MKEYGYIHEIFHSYQGEGPCQGVSQIFVRFSECNLRCQYCDTKQAWNVDRQHQYTADQLLTEIELLSCAYDTNNISITGGEPLCQSGFLSCLLPLLYDRGYFVYLETNGTLPKELDKLLLFVTTVSMDIKLPSSTGEKELWQEHEEFLRIVKGKDIFVKVVVTNNTSEEDWLRALDIISRVDLNMLLVIQPVTPVGDCYSPSEDKLQVFQKQAIDRKIKTKIVPQSHPLLGIR